LVWRILRWRLYGAGLASSLRSAIFGAGKRFGAIYMPWGAVVLCVLAADCDAALVGDGRHATPRIVAPAEGATLRSGCRWCNTVAGYAQPPGALPAWTCFSAAVRAVWPARRGRT